MSSELERLEDWIGALLEKATPAARKKLARKIGVDLRRSQSLRIASQANPDGSGYTPRKNKKQLRGKKGRIRRKQSLMFNKLKMASRMRIQADQNQVGISFLDKVSRIAAVHHFGQKDRVSPKGPEVRYPERRLLGFSKADEQLIMDSVLRHMQE